MKTIIPAFSLFIFSISLVACGGGSSSDSDLGPLPPPATGSISLSWDTPSTKVDGNALSLSEIKGYKVYVTQNNAAAPSQAHADINNNATTSYTISGLQSGKYYIYVSTYDMNNDESPLSDPVSTTL